MFDLDADEHLSRLAPLIDLYVFISNLIVLKTTTHYRFIWTLSFREIISPRRSFKIEILCHIANREIKLSNTYDYFDTNK